jgi:hypothetical protein
MAWLSGGRAQDAKMNACVLSWPMPEPVDELPMNTRPELLASEAPLDVATLVALKGSLRECSVISGCRIK